MYLKTQNSKLLAEIEILRGSSQGPAQEPSMQSWSEVTGGVSQPATEERTPRSKPAAKAKFTPGGTRVPDGSPPRRPSPPPVPPFPSQLMESLDRYEVQHMQRTADRDDRSWWPNQSGNDQVSNGHQRQQRRQQVPPNPWNRPSREERQEEGPNRPLWLPHGSESGNQQHGLPPTPNDPELREWQEAEGDPAWWTPQDMELDAEAKDPRDLTAEVLEEVLKRWEAEKTRNSRKGQKKPWRSTGQNQFMAIHQVSRMVDKGCSLRQKWKNFWNNRSKNGSHLRGIAKTMDWEVFKWRYQCCQKPMSRWPRWKLGIGSRRSGHWSQMWVDMHLTGGQRWSMQRKEPTRSGCQQLH